MQDGHSAMTGIQKNDTSAPNQIFRADPISLRGIGWVSNDKLSAA